jgi:Winged helix DNA-binding domain
MTSPLELSREQVLAHRRRVQALDERLPPGPDSLRQAAWAGLQDSVPRSALHSLHARVEGVGPGAWEDPALVQVWGPRFTAFLVPADAHAAFTLARMPEKGSLPGRADDYAARAHQHLAGRRLPVDDVAAALGIGNGIRYATLTGTLLIRWNGARQPAIWTVPRPELNAAAALQELVRRYLHVYGPSTIEAFVRWGGIDVPAAIAAFDAIAPSLLATRTPLGDAWVLAEDEPMVRRPAAPTDAARLLPSGDPYYLLWGADRELLVSDPVRRAELWTSRVWPGAVLVGGEIVGTWRRSKAVVIVTPWRTLTPSERIAVEAEAATLPLPDVPSTPIVHWED